MIDPLDGTKEFLHRTGEFTVNIALIEDDRPVLGVVYAPVIDKLYFAARGAGSYRTDGKVTTPIKVAATITGSTRFVVSRRHASEQETLTRLHRPDERLRTNCHGQFAEVLSHC